MSRQPFWRDPPAPAPQEATSGVTTLAHLGGAEAADFTRTETRELFAAISAAFNAGARSKADVLAALPPHLREYAVWIASTGAGLESVDGLDADKREVAAREAVTALRLLNVRRELDDLTQAQSEGAGTPAMTARVAQLAMFIREAQRVYPRAAGLSLSAYTRERRGVQKRTEGAA